MIPAQLILKSIGPMFESKDAKAREIAKNIVVGIHLYTCTYQCSPPGYRSKAPWYNIM